MSRIFSVFFILFISLSSLSNPSFAVDLDTYFIKDVEVKVTGESPSDARNTAISQARRDAFLTLLTRLGIYGNLAEEISDDEISYMVRSEQIDGEKIAGNFYSATFNILFAKSFVDHTLKEKQPKAEEEQATYILIPAKMLSNQRLALWESENDWRSAIAKNLEEKPHKIASKFILPEASMQNITFLNRDNIANLDYNAIEPLILKYHADGAYSLTFSYDKMANKVTINLAYITKLQKKRVRLSFINVDKLSYQDLLNKVANKTIDYLNNSKTPKIIKPRSNITYFEIPLSNIGDWLTIKDKIENSNLVNQFNIEAISRDYALVSINYIGDLSIEEGFAKIGFSAIRKSGNLYYLVK